MDHTEEDELYSRQSTSRCESLFGWEGVGSQDRCGEEDQAGGFTKVQTELLYPHVGSQTLYATRHVAFVPVVFL